MKRRFRRRILPIDSPTEPQEPDVTWKNGMITLRGETLRYVEDRAEAEGLSVPDFFNKWVMELINNAKADPGYIDQLLRNLVLRAAMHKRRFAL